MIRLHYSNRTEALLARFVEQLRVQRASTHPLEPVQIIVPNRNMEAYLERGVAEALGVSANFRFARLERFMGAWLERALPDVRIMDRSAYESLLLALLHDEARLGAPALREVREYIEAGGDADARDVRRVQLARRLGQLFEAYGFTRPELLDAFMEGELGTHDPERIGTARFQAALLREITAAHAPRPVYAPRAHYVPLASALTALGGLPEVLGPVAEELLFPETERAARPTLHVFGVSYVARVFQWLYGALGHVADLDLYVVNPCMEFWEDVPSESELRAARSLPRRAAPRELDPPDLGGDSGDERLALHQADEPPLLVAFGRPGREHVHLLNELTQADFEPCFVDPCASALRAGRDPSVLEQLQRDILLRAPVAAAPSTPRVARDVSMRFHACPSVRREVEVVAEQIWRAVREASGGDAPLGFHQIAVLLPSDARDEYLPHVEAVFSEAHGIPHCVVDLDLASTSRVADACLALVELPLGRFARPEVLALVTHPNLLANMPEASIDDVRQLVSELGVFYGLDREELAGTYVDEDRLNWEQGLLRVALGELMSDSRRPDDVGLALGDSHYLPVSTDPSWARAFSLLLRGLIADVRFARSAKRPLREWAQFFAGMWEGYVVPGSEPEQSELRSCLAAANSLVERDVAGLPVSYRVASMLVSEALGSLGAARGDYLADGVVVSSFLPMRAIPFRHTFVLGLGEGSFPARDTRDTMDLRLERRRLGDVRPSERDKYMFLEVLLSARDGLSISWVARDPYTGDEIPPSPVVGLLVDTLRRSYLSTVEAAELIETHALFRHEPLDPASPFAEAHVEAWLRQLGRLARSGLRGRGLGQGDLGDRPPELAEAVAALRGTLPAEDLARLQRELRTISLTEGWRADAVADTPSAAPRVTVTPGAGHEEDEDDLPLETLYLSRAHLARFLEDPQSGWAEALLGVTRADDEEAEESLEDEPFEPSGLTKVVALRQAFWEGSVPGSTLLGAYERTVARLQARGEWPVASLASARRAPDLALLDEWRAGLASLAPAGQRPQRVRLGDALEDGDVERLMPSLALTLADPRPGHRGRLRVMLRGRTEALLENPGQRASLVLEPLPRPSVARARAKREERGGLRGFLDHLLLSASGDEVERHAVQVLYPGEPRPIAVPLAGLSSDAAREYLSALVADLLTGPHAYYAPPTPLLEALPEWGTRSAEAWQAALARTQQDALGRSYGSVPHAEEYPLPSVAELHAMYTRRYGLYVQLRGGVAA